MDQFILVCSFTAGLVFGLIISYLYVRRLQKALIVQRIVLQHKFLQMIEEKLKRSRKLEEHTLALIEGRNFEQSEFRHSQFATEINDINLMHRTYCELFNIVQD